jgi:putative photosynthetic complex assembly protein
MAATTQHFPRVPLAGAILLVAATVVSVAVAQLTHIPQPSLAIIAPIEEQRLVRFEDRSNGGVGIMDAMTGKDIAVAQPGTNGFLRGTLRGLMRTRKRQGIGVTEPFRITRFSTGQIVLRDEATATDIPLNAFGPTNAAVFAAFLSTPEGGSK